MTPQHHLPADIERTSMGIITAELAARGLEIPPENAAVVKRVIHTTADFDYAENLRFTPGAVAAALLGRGEDALAVGIVLQLRLPRAVMVVLLGAALSAAGYLLQTFFANPIAGPFVMGVSSGAKLAVALTMVVFLQQGLLTSSATLIIAAFAGSMAAMAFVLVVVGAMVFLIGLVRYRTEMQHLNTANRIEALAALAGAGLFPLFTVLRFLHAYTRPGMAVFIVLLAVAVGLWIWRLAVDCKKLQAEKSHPIAEKD